MEKNYYKEEFDRMTRIIIYVLVVVLFSAGLAKLALNLFDKC